MTPSLDTDTDPACAPDEGRTDEPTVLLTVSDGIATVLLNRPGARNALNLPMCHELRAVFEAIEDDASIRVVLIRAAGPTFCAGADLKERRGKDAAWVRARRVASFAAYDAIAACTRPVVALVHGTVVGSGGEISMSADFIHAAESTVFRFPEAHWGTVGATQRLQRVIGTRMAKQLLYTNSPLPADRAAELGLVQEVVADDALVEHGTALARRIAEAPADSLRLAKKAIDGGAELTLAEGIAVEMECIEENLAGSTWRDGVARFAESKDAADTSNDTGNAASPDTEGNR